MPLKEMKAELTCPICMELFRQPRRLPCGHSYCQLCIRAMIEKKAEESGSYHHYFRPLVCPECREEISIDFVRGIEAIPTDFKLTKLVELFQFLKDADDSDEEGVSHNTVLHAGTHQLETAVEQHLASVQQAAVSSVNQQTAVSSVNQQTAVSSVSQQTAVSSVSQQTAVSSVSQQTAVSPVIQQAGVSSVIQQTVICHPASDTNEAATLPVNRGWPAESVQADIGGVSGAIGGVSVNGELPEVSCHSDQQEQLSTQCHQDLSTSSLSLPNLELSVSHDVARSERAQSVPHGDGPHGDGPRKHGPQIAGQARRKPRQRKHFFSNSSTSSSSSQDPTPPPKGSTPPAKGSKSKNKGWLMSKFLKSIIFSDSSSSEDSEGDVGQVAASAGAAPGTLQSQENLENHPATGDAQASRTELKEVAERLDPTQDAGQQTLGASGCVGIPQATLYDNMKSTYSRYVPCAPEGGRDERNPVTDIEDLKTYPATDTSLGRSAPVDAGTTSLTDRQLSTGELTSVYDNFINLDLHGRMVGEWLARQEGLAARERTPSTVSSYGELSLTDRLDESNSGYARARNLSEINLAPTTFAIDQTVAPGADGPLNACPEPTGHCQRAVSSSDDEDEAQPGTCMLQSKKKPRSRLKKFLTSLLSLSSSDEDDEDECRTASSSKSSGW
ncbi:uncharacterized protein LOC131942429 isoform X2 [Physella acuta]|uniref:uncharacterized protein LOC131942429 isoform X2 n=1 Tax=Physella acuta TaxID=109671 RepID=UPI0027DDD596|nr:uncharacterized protein LOC131942429 isoform X2 [Physella acuta]